MKALETMSDWTDCLARSEENWVLVLKHSTRCPISSAALREVEAYLAGAEMEAYINYVVEARAVSNQIAADTGVTHASPQLFLLSGKSVKWHTSHGGVTEESIAAHCG